MAPFLTPTLAISGLKERIESLLVHADRLYLGSSTGNLYIYAIDETSGAPLELVDTKKLLVRRSIDQLGFIKDVNSLVVLSEMNVSLFPLPSFKPPTVLANAKAAFSFAIHTSLQHITQEPSKSQQEFSKPQSIPTVVTLLLVGCRRKTVIYSWRDGEPQEVREAPLPHSARSIVFLDNDTACFAYTATEFAMFSVPTMTATEITIPLPTSASTTAMTALTGLTGYMTLGLGAKAKPAMVRVAESEILISKDGQGVFMGPDGKSSRSMGLDWPSPPEEVAFIKPYVMSVLPAGTVQVRPPDTATTVASPPLNQTSLIQVKSSLSHQHCQTLPFPFDVAEPLATQNATIRLLTPSGSGKSPLYLLTTPVDRTAATNDGSTLWSLSLKPWADQLDELVIEGLYSNALSLLEIIEDSSLPDKDQRRTRIKALNAVSQFRSQRYDDAIDTFLELDFNPAKVVALYPESVAGRLAVLQDRWISLYGGPKPPGNESSSPEGSASAPEGDKDKHKDSDGGERNPTDLLDALSGGSIGGRFRKTGLGMFLPAQKDDDTASIIAKRKFTVDDDFHRSIETLVRYLADRRPKLRAALEAVGITPESQSHLASPLSEVSVEDLFSLPNAPISALTPGQLLRYAQIVDTALYKSYMIIRPVLLGSLCRIANWCEVSEVEEDLRARKKFAELKDLYHGKKMHAKALTLLKELADREEDTEDKLGPSISYLQKLGQEYSKLIFQFSRWLFDVNKDMAFQVFTSEDVELERGPVADYLESIDPSLCAKYLEFLISERGDETQGYHDRLAELYLNMTLSAKERGDEKLYEKVYAQLLEFINTNNHFAIDLLYGRLPSTDLYEVRAILLGRMGRHGKALETYVYRLQDFRKAEEYCKRVYQPNGDTSDVFLVLLRIYLRPTAKPVTLTSDLLKPALELISRHGPRLESVETLSLLPPLVTMKDVQAFLVDALRAPVFDATVVKHISKARSDHVAKRLMALQTRRVKITDSRICPQCHKRLGNSVIAVHAPRGEVTHYQCREAFSRRLYEMYGSR